MTGHPKDSMHIVLTDDPATAIFTSFAKVYTMNPNNKTFWLPSSSAPVPVSFYFDKHRSVYRIISYDKKDLVVNSTVFHAMTFIKTSATFGLWSDTKLRTIYGLGFTSKEKLDQFGDWFDKIVLAAKTLEEKIPLPPPAQSAVSLSSTDLKNNTINANCLRPPPDPELHGADISNTSIPGGWYNDSGEGVHSGRCYDAPPKTVHVVDSAIDLSTLTNNGIRGEGDYEDQMTTSPMAKLALENLQYQREVLKVRQLEIEMNSMRATVNTMHEALQRKTVDTEKLRKEASELKGEVDELKSQIETKDEQLKKYEESEGVLKEQIDDFKIQNQETEQFLADKKEEVKYLKSELETAEETKKENAILKERLTQLQSEFDAIDKNWDSVEMACCDMTDLIQGLIAIQGRIKQDIPASPTGEM